MKKPTYLLVIMLTLCIVAVGGYQSIFRTSQQAQLGLISNHDIELSLHCYQNTEAPQIDNKGQLNLTVWNIYKQNKSNWQESLTKLSQDKHLILIQEASMTDEFKQWIEQQGWFANLVDAFEVFDVAAGVLNLSASAPSKACAYTELEPWLRLPKSALYAVYPLSSGEELAVVNIHAVNFTYGTQEYSRQLKTLTDELSDHSGPIIVAGDFNSWSEERLVVMSAALSQLGLKEVVYQPDNRTQFITGLPLDHVFYRGLRLEKAEAPINDASDHNPILVNFRLTSD
ncbi:hypothetical protein TW81_14615 [Vibrio galatheae]|uniref:UPF0294 protein TW81_14615 n=1 Tax=Vibrio galatheae TaxID=579748 RepID=A0A0F4NGS2_9VIBR|nr:endonuclease/exonuclease/phosphatase family protein [Vibrio galatheae]KJY82327.1 hypothetical protein TW81_14615 [Vibrio galatheae]